MVGWMGIRTGIKGVRNSVHAVHVHQGHVGAGEHPAHAILSRAGSRGAAVLVTCKDETMSQKVSDGTASAVERWNGSLTEFLQGLEPSPKDDWVRHALGVPTNTTFSGHLTTVTDAAVPSVIALPLFAAWRDA